MKKIGIIGTGPISLLKAYLLSKNTNVEIHLFESSNRFGGAWYSDVSPMGFEIESGCHIWSYVPEVYEFLRTEFNLNVYPWEPKPYFVTAKGKVPYSTKNTIDTYKHIVKSNLKFRSAQVGQTPIFYREIFSKKYQYPKLGSPELIQVLRKKIEQSDSISIQYNNPIKLVSVYEDKIELNDSIELDELYLTSVSNIEKVKDKLSNEEVTIDKTLRRYIHFLVESNLAPEVKVNYWRLMNDSIIHRVSDISYQTSHQENLFLFGILENQYDSKSQQELFQYCQEYLSKNLYPKSKPAFKLLKEYVYPTYYISGESRAGFSKLSNRISLIHSTDLMHGFYYMLKEHGLI